MILSLRNQIIIAVILVVISYGIGRYTKRQPVSEQIAAQTEIKTQSDSVTDKKTVVTKEPTGKIVTVIVEHTHSAKRQNNESATQKSVVLSPRVQVSALAGIDLRSKQAVYGAAASKQFIGPVTLGVFGLTNGTLGASIGMTF